MSPMPHTEQRPPVVATAGVTSATVRAAMALGAVVA